MGFGPFSSESTTRLETVSTAQSAGFSEIAGPAYNFSFNLGSKTKVGKGGSIAPIINLTDQGALAAARDFSMQSLAGIELLGSRLEGTLQAALAAVAGQSSQAIEAVGSANRTETENLGLTAIKWGALLGAAYLLARAFGALK